MTLPLVIVAVTFNKGGREYFYKTPYAHHKGQLLIVNVAGEYKVVTVTRMVDEDELSFIGELKVIHGICYDLADLEQPMVQSRRPTLFQSLANHFANR